MKPMLSKCGAEYGGGEECGAFEYCYGQLQNLKYVVGVGRAAPFLYTGYVRDSDGQPHGYGVLSSLHHPRTLCFSAYHQGEFRDGVIHGQGVQMLLCLDGWVHTIEGQFACGVSRGYCRSIHWTRGVCEGFMEKGELHGPGTKIYADGSSLSGMWDKGEFQEAGCPSRHAASGCAPADLPPVKRVKELPFVWPSGDGGKYTGMVLRDGGQEHGPGIRAFDDGELQEGEFSNGELNGHGRCKYASGGVYVGSWIAGKRSGLGLYTGCLADGEDFFVLGSYYFGEWSSDLPNGHGARVAPDGSKYVGEFKDGHPDGEGTLTHADGRTECGTWLQGRML